MGSLAYPGIDAAIQNFEGFGTPQAPTITGANNPGAIMAGPFATSQGAVGSAGGFAVFPSVDAGRQAEDQLVQNYAAKGATVQDLITAWAPPNAPGNSPTASQNYINSVSSAVGATPDTPLSQLQGVGLQPGSAAASSSPTIASTVSTWDKIRCMIPGEKACPITSSTSGGIKPTFSFSRIGAFVLGLIMIAGGIYLFKDVQETISRVGRL